MSTIRQSWTTEEETLTVLRDILEIEPLLGEYKEFELFFVPSVKISKFDSYIDIAKILKEL